MNTCISYFIHSFNIVYLSFYSNVYFFKENKMFPIKESLIKLQNAFVLINFFLAHRRMRTVTNYFLVNLSVADLMMSVLNCIFNFIFMLNSNWPFGGVYCTINNFVANVTVASSVFTLVVTSFDR